MSSSSDALSLLWTVGEIRHGVSVSMRAHYNQSTKSIRLFSSPPVLTIIANRLFPDSFGPSCSILKFCVKKGASTRPDLSIQKHFLWRILTINFSKLYYLWVFALWWWLLYHTHVLKIVSFHHCLIGIKYRLPSYSHLTCHARREKCKE